MPSKIIPVIMCGGAGTRLWPASRESMPKQFVPLIGEGTTFQQVMARVSDPELFARPIVVTNEDFRFVVNEQEMVKTLPYAQGGFKDLQKLASDLEVWHVKFTTLANGWLGGVTRTGILGACR